MSLSAYCPAQTTQRIQLPSVHSKVREVISSREIWRLACFICSSGTVVMMQDTNSITRALMLREAVCTGISKAMNEGRQLRQTSWAWVSMLCFSPIVTGYSRKQSPYWLFILHLSSSYPSIKLLTHS